MRRKKQSLIRESKGGLRSLIPVDSLLFMPELTCVKNFPRSTPLRTIELAAGADSSAQSVPGGILLWRLM